MVCVLRGNTGLNAHTSELNVGCGSNVGCCIAWNGEGFGVCYCILHVAQGMCAVHPRVAVVASRRAVAGCLPLLSIVLEQLLSPSMVHVVVPGTIYGA